MSISAELTPSETAQLVLAAQRGEQDAFGRLFEQFERSVYVACWKRVRNHAEAQELCQEVFLQAWRKLRQLREPACFAGWLRSIATRLSINRLVRKSPETVAQPETLDGAWVDSETPLDVALAGERDSLLKAGLGQLKELDRQTLIAFYVQGRSLLEMSDEFSAPLGTIKRRLHVARQRLAEVVESTVAVA